MITVLMGLLLAGCGPLGVENETPSAAPPVITPTNSPTSVPTSAPTGAASTSVPTDVQTYRDEAVGFELDYPTDWVADTTGISDGVILWSRKPEGPGTDGVPADVTKIDVISPLNAPATLEALVTQQKQSLANANGTLLSEERLQLASGLEAVRMHISSFGESIVLLTIINGRPVILAGYGDLSRFDAVARSVRATVSGQPLGFACSIAYADQLTLYCLGEGGTPIPIAQASQAQGETLTGPAISHDGAWVAYTLNKADHNSELWAVDVRTLTGNNGLNLPRRRLAGADQIGYGQPEFVTSPLAYEWQAGTHTLYFNTRYATTGGQIGPGEFVYNDLWKVDAEADGGGPINVLSRDSVGRFALSPDGQFIAISNPQAIGLMRADGTNFKLALEFPFIITYSEYAYKPVPEWSPDSTYFNLLVPSEDPLAADASATLYRVFVADGSIQGMGTLPGNFVMGNSADISPDGQRVAYLRTEQTANTVELHFVNADGTGDIKAGEGVALNGLGWSPDSKHYVYAIVMGGGNYVAGLQAPEQQFAPGLQAMAVEWVDNLSFYFLGGEAQQWGLYFQRLGEPTQTLVTELTPPITFDVRP